MCIRDSHLLGAHFASSDCRSGVVHHSMSRVSGNSEIHGLPAGTVMVDPSGRFRRKVSSMESLDQVPSSTWPPANTRARPEPTVSIAGTELPDFGGYAVYRRANSTTSVSAVIGPVVPSSANHSWALPSDVRV